MENEPSDAGDGPADDGHSEDADSDVEASHEGDVEDGSSSEDDSEDHRSANPCSPCHDDDATLVLGEVSPNSLPAAEADQSDESELEGSSESESAACVATDAPSGAVVPFNKSCSETGTSDGESVDLGADVPNLPADSSGNTDHGFNLACLHVPPLPPSLASSEDDDGDVRYIRALQPEAKKYITPAKRPAPDHEQLMSTVKTRKEKGKASDAAVDKSWVETPKAVEVTCQEIR